MRACELEGASEADAVDKSQHLPRRRTTTLTEEEIISNLFVFAFAGNDTTAVSMTNLLVVLSAHPEVQDWISEEICHYLPDDDMTQWDYRTFPKLKRCLAVIVRTYISLATKGSQLTNSQMESLRLNHPLSQLVKTTGNQSLPVQLGSKTYTLPPQTNIHLNLSALHTLPQHWGNDSLRFDPYRFITPSSGAAPAIEEETLAPDTTKTFIPWVHGQRLCPGKKFSQVELVAALVMLFRDHRVQPELLPGEGLETARKRMARMGLDVDHEGTMLVEISDPKGARLTWVRR